MRHDRTADSRGKIAHGPKNAQQSPDWLPTARDGELNFQMIESNKIDQAAVATAPPVETDSPESVYAIYRELMDKTFGEDSESKACALLVALSLQSRLLRETFTLMKVSRRKIYQARKLETKVCTLSDGLNVRGRLRDSAL